LPLRYLVLKFERENVHLLY